MTVRVRLLVRLFHLGEDLPPGHEFDVDEELAAAFVATGVAEIVT
jgi:hypothetical protein